MRPIKDSGFCRGSSFKVAKSIGTGIDWIQIPRMKLDPDSIGISAVGHVAMEKSYIAEAMAA